MDISKLTFTIDDFGYFIPDEPIRPPFWENEMELWVDSEHGGQQQPSANQYHALSQFFQLDPHQLLLLREHLALYKEELKADRRILKKSKKFNLTDITFTVILIPRQDRSANQYVIVLADTNWKIRRSQFTIELEVLFTNNQFQVVQEMTGLWGRLEWETDFNA
ncbi:hypothetical protein F0L74_24430 [Chitinophaga agrisoli]|uniref:Uncharacterized protein n=1 Tax=Chitinophaga agrisoli TaxID=2607653 RepID=A0A5B2VKL4_9BACT|nr:hypothetical protein [Chitinophaga agrisoli]KAA2239354.1 hypothetical protein F0L74_24430 [Chitinophaga agrisoli]